MLKHAERIARAEDQYERAKAALEQAEVRYDKAAAALRQLKLIEYCKECDVVVLQDGERTSVLAAYKREDGEPELNVFYGQGVEAGTKKVRGHEIAEVYRNEEKL